MVLLHVDEKTCASSYSELLTGELSMTCNNGAYVCLVSIFYVCQWAVSRQKTKNFSQTLWQWVKKMTILSMTCNNGAYVCLQNAFTNLFSADLVKSAVSLPTALSSIPPWENFNTWFLRPPPLVYNKYCDVCPWSIYQCLKAPHQYNVKEPPWQWSHSGDKCPSINE